MINAPITFPVYLVSGRQAEIPILLRAASLPISVPLFSSVESAGAFLVQSDFLEDSEIWRIESATALKPWLERIADQCECVPWDLASHRGRWHSAGASAFSDFFAAVTNRAASERQAAVN